MAEPGGAADTSQPAGSDTRKRLARWIEDGQALLSVLPGVLEEHDKLNAKAQAAEQECERLRQEIGGLRNENQLLRTERAEIIETLGKLLNQTPQLMNDMLQRLRAMPPRKSPFESPAREKPSERPTA